MPLGETDSFCRKPVQIRCVNILRAEATHIADPEIIRQDDNNVRLGCRLRGERSYSYRSKKFAPVHVSPAYLAACKERKNPCVSMKIPKHDSRLSRLLA